MISLPSVNVLRSFIKKHSKAIIVYLPILIKLSKNPAVIKRLSHLKFFNPVIVTGLTNLIILYLYFKERQTKDEVPLDDVKGINETPIPNQIPEQKTSFFMRAFQFLALEILPFFILSKINSKGKPK